MLRVVFMIIPIVAILALVLGATNLLKHYLTNIRPVQKAAKEANATALQNFHQATDEYQWINRNWIELIENNPAREIDIPSSTNLKIDEVSDFLRAKQEFATVWDDKLLIKAKFNKTDKMKFSKNVQELKDYYRSYISKVIETDNPSKEFQIKAFPSDKKFLS